MADMCDEADKSSQALLDASIANARLKLARIKPRWFEACQFCAESTVDGLPYCDDDCKNDHRHELSVLAKQFDRS